MITPAFAPATEPLNNQFFTPYSKGPDAPFHLHYCQWLYVHFPRMWLGASLLQGIANGILPNPLLGGTLGYTFLKLLQFFKIGSAFFRSSVILSGGSSSSCALRSMS